MRNSYDLVMSLGGHCKPAWHIRERLGFSKAMPFDWWIVGPEAVATLLAHDSGVLFDVKNLAPIWDGTSIIDERWTVIHHHDFKRDAAGKMLPDLESQIPNLREKFKFLFDRMDETCLSSEAICCIHAVSGHDVHPHNSSVDKIRERAIMLHDALIKRWPGRVIDLLLLDAGPVLPDTYPHGEHTLYFDAIDKDDGDQDEWRSGAYRRMFDRQGLEPKTPAGTLVMSDMLEGETWV